MTGPCHFFGAGGPKAHLGAGELLLAGGPKAHLGAGELLLAGGPKAHLGAGELLLAGGPKVFAYTFGPADRASLEKSSSRML
jgi:hypothetical protein